MRSTLSFKLQNAITIAELQQKNALTDLKEELLILKRDYEPSKLFGLLSNNFISTQNTDFKKIISKTALTFAIAFISKNLTQNIKNSTMQKIIQKASEFFLHKFS